jgi:4-hydroxy-tetrahydrodipicolinate reductase
MINTVIIGAGGRMGQSLIQLLSEFPALRLHGAVDSAQSPLLGTEQGGHKLRADLPAALQGAQLAIDFSNASGAREHIEVAHAVRVPLLLGTTGLPADAISAAERAACEIPLLISANTSVGVALLADLVQRAARSLGREFHIEVIEAHHRHKLDAPSGTALLVAEAAARGRGTHYAAVRAAQPRGSAGERSDDEIGIASIRGGDVVGEHEVLFLGPGERLSLRHSATDRSIFARGALRAGQWLAGQAPGRYQMADVFGK